MLTWTQVGRTDGLTASLFYSCSDVKIYIVLTTSGTAATVLVIGVVTEKFSEAFDRSHQLQYVGIGLFCSSFVLVFNKDVKHDNYQFFGRS